MPTVDLGGFYFRVYLFFLFPIYEYTLLPVYQYVFLPIFMFVLLPVFWVINGVFGWIAWVYGFRCTLMVQGLVFYWRAFIYFERSTLWKKLLEKDELHERSYLVPVLWTTNGIFVIFIIILVLVTTFLGENNMRRLFNIQGRVGFNFYCLGKSTGELTILKLMVILSDNAADTSTAEINIAACFVCGYISIVSLMKLCYIGNDLGFIDGIASVTLSIYTHYCKTNRGKVYGTFMCWLLVLVKNILFTDCCGPCSEADTIGLPVGGGATGGGNGHGGGDGGNGGGGGGGGGGHPGRDQPRGRGSSLELSIPIADTQPEVFYSARSSTSARNV